MPEILAKTSMGSYGVTIANHSLSRTGKIVKPLVKGAKAFVVTDKNVAERYWPRVKESLEKAGFLTAHYEIDPGEKSKAETTLFTLYDRFHAFGITRSDLIVALGGGVVGDLAGFAAATFLRGVPLVQVPTTLLAQTDSSIGGKTAIDLPYGKNLVGAFYHPLAVVMDPIVLASLPKAVLNDGMAEVIKYGCIRDADLFRQIESGRMDLEWILERCVRIKTTVVANDERDAGERMLLNFGHTIGHAVEKAADYGRFTHGQAVAVGMAVACRLGECLGVTPEGTAQRVRVCLEKFGLPTECPLPAEEILTAVRSDKKTLSDTIYFVLLKEIGEGFLYPTSFEKLGVVLREVLEHG